MSDLLPRRLLAFAGVAGVALALAPVGTQMLTGALSAGRLLAELRPVMSQPALAALSQGIDGVGTAVAGLAVADPAPHPERHSAVVSLGERWPSIEADVRGVVADLGGELSAFHALDELPPLALLPWSLALAGLTAAGLAFLALRTRAAWAVPALGVLGLGLLAAPAVVQFPARAPMADRLVESLAPVVAAERVAVLQDAFLAVGGAEGQLRLSYLPANPAGPDSLAGLVDAWPAVAADLSQLIGALAASAPHHAALAALPPWGALTWVLAGAGLLFTTASLLTLRALPVTCLRVATLLAALALAAACQAPRAEKTRLEGLYRLHEGRCVDAGVTRGSYFRLALPDGTAEHGPFVVNPDSPCGDKTYTPLHPGRDGGLLLGARQPPPAPAFAAGGNGLADGILAPRGFFALKLGASTGPLTDAGGAGAVPTLFVWPDGTVGGDLSAFTVAWNGEHLLQGAPRRGDEGSAQGPGGWYEESTAALTVYWTSEVAVGAFAGFTGVWRLEGEFVP